MKAVLLCAGFGTRLYPLTENQPKALLEIAGEPLLNYLIRKLEKISSLDEVILVSNERFYQNFCDWQQTLKSRLKLTMVNDGTMTPETRLGAIKDLKLALDKANANEDVIVLAGDNLFDSDLTSLASFAVSKKLAIIGVYEIKDRVLAQKYGLIKADPSGKITAFYEKPKDPPSLLASMGVYFFPKETLKRIDEYLLENQNPDAPGYYISWFTKRSDTYIFRFDGTWFDIGDLESYRTANQHFEKIKNAQK